MRGQKLSIDETHDASRRSWILSANDHRDFPIQNLPFGIFDCGSELRGGVAIGDQVLDLSVLLQTGLLSGQAAMAAAAAAQPELRDFLQMGREPRQALRTQLSVLLQSGAAEGAQLSHTPNLLHSIADVTLHLPMVPGDYTDFYAGIHHAERVGLLFRPDNPLLPNYKHVPIGYHGRASSIRPSGVPVRRPHGQRADTRELLPTFGPSQKLDFELELGIWIGPASRLGEPIPIGRASDHIAGYCLLNDWSARDIQAWEYRPLGPFLGKNFHTTISPWVITPEALAPYRIAQPARPAGDPRPLDYLWDVADQTSGSLAIDLKVELSTPRTRASVSATRLLSEVSSTCLYWTPAQLVAHHTSGGCDLRAGDLFGTGTISGPDLASCGSFLELAHDGQNPLTLGNGEMRSFLEDGDEIVMTATCSAAGFVTIGFGECRAMVVAAP